MTNGNFFLLLSKGMRKKPENAFLTTPCGKSLSFRQIDDIAAQIAGTLQAYGVKPGDRIVVQVDKSAENVALYLAAMRAGIVYVPLNTAYTVDEVAYFLANAQPTIFICDPEKATDLKAAASAADVQHLLTLGADGSGTLMDAAHQAEPFNDVTTRHPDDLAVILYTSGTTGRSKGAMLTHQNLSSNAVTLSKIWDIKKTDVLLHALPIFHIHGLFVALHTSLLNGCEILFLPKFDVGEVLKALPRASLMMGVPTFYTRLIADPQFTRQSTAHMRLFISGSAPLTQEAFNAFEARTGHRILERYGMSEAGMITSNPLNGDRLAGTVGFALPEVSLRIASETGDLVETVTPGGVEVKGPNIFKGYWQNPGKTAEEFTKDGFFKTGDIGLLSEDGRLTLMGRSKDLIIAGGYNIYPKEIEQHLDATKGIAESAVIGTPHPDLGEGVCAILVAENTPVDDDVIKAALSSLAKFKRPRKFFWVEQLPRNAMGKVQKQALRERYKTAFTPR